MTDIEIINAIRRGDLEKPIQSLYKEFPKIRVFLLKGGGNDTIIPEIFNDSLVLLIEKISDNSFELSSKLSTYLSGINRFLLKNELRKIANKPLISLDSDRNYLELENEFGYDFEKEEKLNALEGILNTISEKCKQILSLFYFEKKNMDYIADNLGFSSVNSAKTQKYKCLEKAHQLANESIIHVENSVL
ncbi:MAG: sigma-70 family RNA polymerase sigma factor [Flavobacteriia bacterium]|nr:sigma-70 family RNA polymerase sigma factor [Flavobacteriia bacterium]